jgi:thioredoxin 1
MKATTMGFNGEYCEEVPSLDEIDNLSGMALLEFGAPWCSHCQAAQNVLEESLIALTELPHIKVFDGKGKRLGRRFGVKLWPTLILLKDGKELERIVRFTSFEEVHSLLAKVKT